MDARCLTGSKLLLSHTKDATAVGNCDYQSNVFFFFKNDFLSRCSLFQAEGYTDGDLTLFHSLTVTDFLKAENPVDFLAKASEVSPRSCGTSPLAKSDTFLCAQIIPQDLSGFSVLNSVLSYSDHFGQQRPGVSCNNYQ